MVSLAVGAVREAGRAREADEGRRHDELARHLGARRDERADHEVAQAAHYAEPEEDRSRGRTELVLRDAQQVEIDREKHAGHRAEQRPDAERADEPGLGILEVDHPREREADLGLVEDEHLAVAVRVQRAAVDVEVPLHLDRRDFQALVLEELGEPYDIHLVSFKKGENLQPEYLAINPMGKVPAVRHTCVTALSSCQP